MAAKTDAADQSASCGRKCLSVCAASSKHIIVIVAIVAYSCLGGSLFKMLELLTEEENCWKNKDLETRVRGQTLKAIW